jgi:AraC-like DNA-binding protein
MTGFYASADCMLYKGFRGRAAGASRGLLVRQFLIEPAAVNGVSCRSTRLTSARTCLAGSVTKGTKIRGRDMLERAAWLPERVCGEEWRPRLLVAQAETLVLQYLPERLNEQFLSERLGVKVLDLHRAFRDIRGAVPYMAFHALRIDEVKRRQDADSALSVETTMRQCGFGSYAFLRRKFIEKFGIDPKEFRKNQCLAMNIANKSKFSNHATLRDV